MLDVANKIAAEYGAAHEPHCHLNDENSDDHCDCAVSFMVDAIVDQLTTQVEAETLGRVRVQLELLHDQIKTGNIQPLGGIIDLQNNL